VEKYVFSVFLALDFTNRDDKSAWGNGKRPFCARLHRVRKILL
jgi:hypothetical protein